MIWFNSVTQHGLSLDMVCSLTERNRLHWCIVIAGSCDWWPKVSLSWIICPAPLRGKGLSVYHLSILICIWSGENRWNWDVHLVSAHIYLQLYPAQEPTDLLIAHIVIVPGWILVSFNIQIQSDSDSVCANNRVIIRPTMLNLHQNVLAFDTHHCHMRHFGVMCNVHQTVTTQFCLFWDQSTSQKWLYLKVPQSVVFHSMTITLQGMISKSL